ncbi:MAG: hypothetical protein JWM51_1089 [Microbacteriaceae bacterium]|nr:hypothetical protein [Microbacteriaceae bacterium]
MTKTRPSILLLIAVLAGVVGWLLEMALVASGRAAVVPPLTLATALALIGIIVVVLALPVSRVARGTATTHVDPFFATRVVVLAKAASITGALIGGAAIAVLVFLLTRSVVPGGDALAPAIATAVASVVLVAGGLIAERMCTLPPSDEDPPEEQSSRERA